MLVGQGDAVSGTAVCGDVLYSPGVWIKIGELLKEFCKHLLKRKVVAGNADTGKELAGQVAIWYWKAIDSLLESLGTCEIGTKEDWSFCLLYTHLKPPENVSVVDLLMMLLRYKETSLFFIVSFIN